MSQDKVSTPDPESGSVGIPYDPKHDLLHDPVQEDIVLNRWRLRAILEESAKMRHRFEDSFVWFGVLLAFLLALLPQDFEEFLTLSGDVWTAIAMIGATFSVFKILQIWWKVWSQRNEPHKAPDQLVQEIVAEMKARREEVWGKQVLAQVDQPDQNPDE